MRHINSLKAGLAVGAVIGLWHLLWASLVALGLAKPLMDFVLRLHFIELQYQLAPFAMGTAVTLIVITFGVGFAFGSIFALVWNWLNSQPGAEADAPGAASSNEQGHIQNARQNS